MSLASLYLINSANEMIVHANEARSSHIGLFDGETTFSLSSETGILPALEIETKDVYGKNETYESSSGNITIPNYEKTIKSMVLKGQTLEQLATSSGYEASIMPSYTDYTIDVANATNRHLKVTLNSSLSGWGYGRVWFKKEKIKPNTKYIIVGKTLLGVSRIDLKCGDSSGKWSDDGAGVTYNKYAILETNALSEPSTHQVIFLSFGYSSPKTVEIKDVQMFEYKEGMEKWNVSFFESYQSVINPTLTISNGNDSQIATITVEEDIILRSNGDIYDELDLMTGKFTQRIAEDGTILNEEIVRYVKINSTHTFEQNKDADISVVGNITPILGSITVPTDPLSFTLNPNLEKGQQFIAPDFSISNDSQAPIGLEIKSFEQTTTLLNDVLPDKYDSWEGLNKTQSKDIALALEPQPSESWISLNEGSYYVTNISDIELGRVKGNSTVDFKFSALHGQSFTETLIPQYKLTFIFEF